LQAIRKEDEMDKHIILKAPKRLLWAKNIIESICDKYYKDGFIPIVFNGSPKPMEKNGNITLEGNDFRLMKEVDSDRYVILTLSTGEGGGKHFNAHWSCGSERIRKLNEEFQEIPVRKYMGEFCYDFLLWEEPYDCTEGRKPADMEKAKLEIMNWIDETKNSLEQDLDRIVNNPDARGVPFPTQIAVNFLNKDFEKALETALKSSQNPYIRIVDMDQQIIAPTMISQNYLANVFSRCKSHMETLS